MAKAAVSGLLVAVSRAESADRSVISDVLVFLGVTAVWLALRYGATFFVKPPGR